MQKTPNKEEYLPFGRQMQIQEYRCAETKADEVKRSFRKSKSRCYS